MSTTPINSQPQKFDLTASLSPKVDELAMFMKRFIWRINRDDLVSMKDTLKTYESLASKYSKMALGEKCFGSKALIQKIEKVTAKIKRALEVCDHLESNSKNQDPRIAKIPGRLEKIGAELDLNTISLERVNALGNSLMHCRWTLNFQKMEKLSPEQKAEQEELRKKINILEKKSHEMSSIMLGQQKIWAATDARRVNPDTIKLYVEPMRNHMIALYFEKILDAANGRGYLQEFPNHPFTELANQAFLNFPRTTLGGDEILAGTHTSIAATGKLEEKEVGIEGFERYLQKTIATLIQLQKENELPVIGAWIRQGGSSFALSIDAEGKIGVFSPQRGCYDDCFLSLESIENASNTITQILFGNNKVITDFLWVTLCSSESLEKAKDKRDLIKVGAELSEQCCLQFLQEMLVTGAPNLSIIDSKEFIGHITESALDNMRKRGLSSIQDWEKLNRGQHPTIHLFSTCEEMEISKAEAVKAFFVEMLKPFVEMQAKNELGNIGVRITCEAENQTGLTLSILISNYGFSVFSNRGNNFILTIVENAERVSEYLSEIVSKMPGENITLTRAGFCEKALFEQPQKSSFGEIRFLCNVGFGNNIFVCGDEKSGVGSWELKRAIPLSFDNMTGEWVFKPASNEGEYKFVLNNQAWEKGPNRNLSQPNKQAPSFS